jgi:hypothetical protein
VVKVQRDGDESTCQRCCSQSEGGGGVEPTLPCRCGLRERGDWLLSLLGEEDDLTAVRAFGDVRERGEALVFRESVLDEGVELVGIEMLAGLEELTHDCFVSAVVV